MAGRVKWASLFDVLDLFVGLVNKIFLKQPIRLFFDV